jgi:arylsulfatase
LTTDADSSEAHNVAERHPDRVEESKTRGLEEAKANNVLPLKDIKAHRSDGTQLT